MEMKHDCTFRLADRSFMGAYFPTKYSMHNLRYKATDSLISGSAAAHLTCVCGALGSIPSTPNRKLKGPTSPSRQNNSKMVLLNFVQVENVTDLREHCKGSNSTEDTNPWKAQGRKHDPGFGPKPAPIF